MAPVVDASVALKWALREPDSLDAFALLRSGEELLLPDFWLAEAASAMWTQVRKRLMSEPDARVAFDILRRHVQPTSTAGMDLHSRALDIALAVNHSPYDALHIAFALAIGAHGVVMADWPFANAMRHHPDRRIAAMPIELSDWARGRGRP